MTGVQRYAAEIVTALDRMTSYKSSYQFILLTPPKSQVPVLKNIEVRRVGIGGGHFWEQFLLPWFSRSGALLCLGNTAPIISLISSQWVMVTIHDLSYLKFKDSYSLSFRFFYNFIMPLVAKYANALTTVSETEKNQIRLKFPFVGSRLTHVPNGVISEDIYPDIVESNVKSRGYLLYVGSLSRRKNIDSVIAVAIQLAKHNGINTYIVGSVPKGLIDGCVNIPEEIKNSIHFMGHISGRSELAELYRGALCFLFPSRYESSGLPPLEAMAYGCPVVVSNLPALMERCGNAALYCKPDDIEAMVLSVLSLVNDKDLRDRMINLGYERARMFTWVDSAKELISKLPGSVGIGDLK